MKIRLPADLKDQIEVASKQSGRSMNAEIVARLTASFGTTVDLIEETASGSGSTIEADLIAEKVVNRLISLAGLKETDIVTFPTDRDNDYVKLAQRVLSGTIEKPTPNSGPKKSPNAKRTIK